MRTLTVRQTPFIFPVTRDLSLCLAVNRLDRLTSGLMIVPLNAELASILGKEFLAGTIQKEYVARCKGEFPE